MPAQDRLQLLSVVLVMCASTQSPAISTPGDGRGLDRIWRLWLRRYLLYRASTRWHCFVHLPRRIYGSRGAFRTASVIDNLVPLQQPTLTTDGSGGRR